MGIEFAGIARQVVKLVSYTVTKFWDIIEMFVYCLFALNKIIFLISFSCLIWYCIERYGRELSTVQR